MDKFVVKTLAFSSTKKEVPIFRPIWQLTIEQGTLHVDDGLMFFSSCNIRAFYTRENKRRLTLATVYKIRKRNYLYEYIFPDVNVDFVPFIRGEHSSLL